MQKIVNANAQKSAHDSERHERVMPLNQGKNDILLHQCMVDETTRLGGAGSNIMTT